jgi:hypothetical protein
MPLCCGWVGGCHWIDLDRLRRERGGEDCVQAHTIHQVDSPVRMLSKNFLPSTNWTLIVVLSFLACFAGNTAALAHCIDNGRYFYRTLCRHHRHAHRLSNPKGHPAGSCTSVYINTLFLQHRPCHLCYDGIAHAHGGRARDREDTRWTLSRWWIKRLPSCASGAA